MVRVLALLLLGQVLTLQRGAQLCNDAVHKYTLPKWSARFNAGQRTISWGNTISGSNSTAERCTVV